MDDADRFRALFERCHEAVRRFAHHRSIEGVEADDLVADTFLVVWRRLDAVPDDEPLPWVLAVAANVRRNHLRGSYRFRSAVRRLPAPEVVHPPEVPDARPARLRAALASLRPDDQEILRLVAWDGLTPSEAAVVLGCPPGTARARLSRARARLARLLDAADGDAPAPEGGNPSGRDDRDDPGGRQRLDACGQASTESVEGGGAR
jgi:RNA polymerase sigma-70 factor, ECF subfamily